MTGAKVGFAAIVIAYPLIVYFGLEYFDARVVAAVLIGLALLRLIVARNVRGLSSLMPQTRLVVIALLVFGLLTFASNVPVLLQYYPVAMNVLMFALFFTSLLRPPSIIERIARVTTPDLPEVAVAYTRKVTMVWCGFFVLNGSMALYTTLNTSLGFWAVYNSLISYSLIGMLLGGEYLVRRVVKRKMAAQASAGGSQ
ncbi:MAG: putative membrane protein [Paracoccaceae bacterium]|jgi:uncharacterized membrane protein